MLSIDRVTALLEIRKSKGMKQGQNIVRNSQGVGEASWEKVSEFEQVFQK